MKKGLILEGGAMRGLFTAGVMDVLMQDGVRFDGAIGVAAGAGRGALEVDEPAVAPADGLQEPGEVACGPVCHGAQCAPPVGAGVRVASGRCLGECPRRGRPHFAPPALDRRVRTLGRAFEG